VTDKGKGKLYTLHDVAAPAPDGDIDSGSESDVEMFDGPESPSQGKRFDEMEFDSDDRDDPNWEPSDVKMDDDS
jgi:hypothetical protein